MQTVRVPSQKRAQESWEHLLKVAEELISEVGFSGVTSAELSRRSGISNGAIFWRVKSMDALFVAVHERFLEQLTDEQRVFDDPDLWADLDLEEFVAASVRATASLYENHGPMLVALNARLPSDVGTASRASEAVEAAGAKFLRHLGPVLERAHCAEPEVVAAALFEITYGALLTRVTWPAQQTPVGISWDRFVDELCEMSVAYAVRHTAGNRG